MTAATTVLFARFLIKTWVPSLRMCPLPLVRGEFGFLQHPPWKAGFSWLLDLTAMQVEVTLMSKGGESHIFIPRRAGTFEQEGSAGGRCWDLGVLGMCVCLHLCVCTFPDTLLRPKYLWELCVAATVLHSVLNWVLPGFPHPSLMQDKLSYKYVSYLN